MQSLARCTVLAEQMTTMWRQADSECGTFFYQHYVVLAVNQVLTNCRDLDVDLRLVAELLHHLYFTC
jgi:hypothetical protein